MNTFQAMLVFVSVVTMSSVAAVFNFGQRPDLILTHGHTQAPRMLMSNYASLYERTAEPNSLSLFLHPDLESRLLNSDTHLSIFSLNYVMLALEEVNHLLSMTFFSGLSDCFLRLQILSIEHL